MNFATPPATSSSLVVSPMGASNPGGQSSSGSLFESRENKAKRLLSPGISELLAGNPGMGKTSLLNFQPGANGNVNVLSVSISLLELIAKYLCGKVGDDSSGFKVNSVTDVSGGSKKVVENKQKHRMIILTPADIRTIEENTGGSQTSPPTAPLVMPPFDPSAAGVVIVSSVVSPEGLKELFLKIPQIDNQDQLLFVPEAGTDKGNIHVQSDDYAFLLVITGFLGGMSDESSSVFKENALLNRLGERKNISKVREKEGWYKVVLTQRDAGVIKANIEKDQSLSSPASSPAPASPQPPQEVVSSTSLSESIDAATVQELFSRTPVLQELSDITFEDRSSGNVDVLSGNENVLKKVARYLYGGKVNNTDSIFKGNRVERSGHREKIVGTYNDIYRIILTQDNIKVIREVVEGYLQSQSSSELGSESVSSASTSLPVVEMSSETTPPPLVLPLQQEADQVGNPATALIVKPLLPQPAALTLALAPLLASWKQLATSYNPIPQPLSTSQVESAWRCGFVALDQHSYIRTLTLDPKSAGQASLSGSKLLHLFASLWQSSQPQGLELPTQFRPAYITGEIVDDEGSADSTTPLMSSKPQPLLPLQAASSPEAS
jgi:hypothetical protein